MSKRVKLAGGIAGVVACAFAVWTILIEPNRLIIHAEEIKLDHWPVELNGLKIAALGDIHAGSAFIDEAKLSSIVRLTNDQHADLIVLLGDYVVTGRLNRNPIEPEATALVLKDLRAPLGVYAVLGNHDAWLGKLRVRKAFESVGIRVLENQSLQLHKDQYPFALVGLADWWTGAHAIQATLSTIPFGTPTIAITHNPDLFVDLPVNVNLLIAAHTHGGQVNLPFLGRLIVPSNYGQRFAAGLVAENGKHLFVTTGIGTSILPVRFRVPPEIAVLTLRSN